MHIEQARGSEALEMACVLQAAAQWLADDGRALWTPAEISQGGVSRDTDAGLFYVVREAKK